MGAVTASCNDIARNHCGMFHIPSAPPTGNARPGVFSDRNLEPFRNAADVGVLHPHCIQSLPATYITRQGRGDNNKQRKQTTYRIIAYALNINCQHCSAMITVTVWRTDKCHCRIRLSYQHIERAISYLSVHTPCSSNVLITKYHIAYRIVRV